MQDHNAQELQYPDTILQQAQLLHSIERAIPFALEFSTMNVYRIKKDAASQWGSTSTVYRRLRSLETVGLAKLNRGKFQIKTSVISQPSNILKKLMPSLISLKQARRFGRSYSHSDIKFSMDNIQDKFVTLDYAAWNLTKFQLPSDLFIYVEDVEKTANFLGKNNFSEGKRGHVILLPKIGDFSNEIERVYLDSIANGERSMLDAIAIQLLHGDKITTKGLFSIDDIKKVEEDMPTDNQR
jgi:hypothetical protein